MPGYFLALVILKRIVGARNFNYLCLHSRWGCQMGPGFSERTFEFCYNAEYCQRNAALLATHPHIPSQQAEKDLGYDVEFQIDNGSFTRSLFLQHKVASFAERKAGK